MGHRLILCLRQILVVFFCEKLMLTNTTNIPLPFAVFLAYDDYDHNPDPLTISTTTIIKTTREIILSSRMTGKDISTDITDLAPSSFGTAVHAAVEKPWMNGGYKKAMASLGHPQHVIDAIKINPKVVSKGDIPLYFEQRTQAKLGKWTISGKYDIVFQNQVMDIKTTKAYAYIKQSKAEDFVLQGSIYRWLNSDIITDDTLVIQYYFTDWSTLESQRQKGYPPRNILTQKFELMSLAQTEHYLTSRLTEIEDLMDADETALPLCSPKALWQDAPKFKYYKNPAKLLRSTKNFDTAIEANKRLAEDGFIGVVKEVFGPAKHCKFCSGRPICSQAKNLEAQGLLAL